MTFTRIDCFLFVCLLGSGKATICTSDDDCLWSESCCVAEGVCRESCPVYYCSYDYQCSDDEHCCDGICSLSCANISPSPSPTAGPGTGWSQSQVMGLIIFILFFVSVISCICCCCCFCSCCPCYRHRESRRQVAPRPSTPQRAYVVYRRTAIATVTAHSS